MDGFSVLHTLLAQLGQSGQFKNNGIQTSLDAKLSQAEEQFQKGHNDQAFKHLSSAKGH
jgi:hypothetical protein